MQRYLRATCIASAALSIACAIWALAPLPKQSPLPVLQPVPEPIRPQPAENETIDSTMFAAKLWNPPPVPQKEEVAQAEPPKPLNLQLIGIIYEGSDVRSAAVYDIDSDRLFILSNGDQIGGQTVQSITEQGIELTDGRSTHRLALKQAPS